jgi:hypothetical protein
MKDQEDDWHGTNSFWMWITKISPPNAPEFDFRSKVTTIATSEDFPCEHGWRQRTQKLPYPIPSLDEAGEAVIVTARGNPIALIQPIKTAEKVVSLEVRLARLAAQGLLTLPPKSP